MLAAVAVWFSKAGKDGAVAAVVIAVLASLMVSYTRARAESLGVDCREGLLQRPERYVILGGSSMISTVAMTPQSRILHRFRSSRGARPHHAGGRSHERWQAPILFLSPGL